MSKKTKTAKRDTQPTDYFSEFEEWPSKWMIVDKDLKIGTAMIESFEVFVGALIDDGMSPKTIKKHMQNLDLLGAEIIRRLNDEDSSYRKLSSNALLLKYIDDESGPLLPFWDPNDNTELAYHKEFDATCRKLFRFISPPF